MKALQYHSRQLPLTLKEVPEPVALEEEIILHVPYSGLNHRDIYITQGLYPNLQADVTMGSDGVGYWNDQVFVINPNIGWGADQEVPENSYSILGMPQPGTFARLLSIPKHRLVVMPGHLTLPQGAALPLAGLTAYRLLFSRCNISSRDRVCISGIGGGVALMAMQFVLALGAEVWVTSSSEEKINKAIGLGASDGQLYTEENWHKKLLKKSDGFDIIIDSAGGEGFSLLISTARKGARIGIYGGSAGLIQNLSPQRIFWKHLNIYGSSMGSDADFYQMIQFVEEYKIVPVIDSVYNLSDFQKAFARMERGDQFGKIIFDNNK